MDATAEEISIDADGAKAEVSPPSKAIICCRAFEATYCTSSAGTTRRASHSKQPRR
jgi:hypothetical protein